jgi:UDP-N-acetylmuramate--alanine ligase
LPAEPSTFGTNLTGSDLTGAPRKFHIVGVGGAGMSGIARLLVGMGHQVSGSDARCGATLEQLAHIGVRTFVGHDAANIEGAEVVSHSSAIGPNNVELAEARSRGVPVLRRAQLLAAICATRKSLAVSGTHGKTTTTAMLAGVLSAAGMRPSWLVGGDPVGGAPSAQWTDGDWLVVEADESDGTFLQLGAHGVLVTSVEPDHLDYFGTIGELQAAFGQFVGAASGPRAVCLDDPGAAALVEAPGGAVTYGVSPGATYRAERVELAGDGATFCARAKGDDLGCFELAVPGAHNVRNALGALALAMEAGASPEAARRALAGYTGVARRFERRGSKDGITYIDDYAHLPGEVKATLATARRGPWDRVVAVFQPHRFSRTEALWPAFADAFVEADLVVLTGVYPAGEQERPGVNGHLVEQAVRLAHPELAVEYVEGRPELVELLHRLLRPGDLCLTMGAGDVTTVPAELMGGEP